MRPVVASELKSIKDNVDQEIAQVFGSKRDRRVAARANAIMHDVLTQPPIGWNVGTTRLEYNAACSKIVEDQYLEQHPVGLIPEFIIIALIGGIISWLVQRWLDDLFPKE